MSQQRLDAVIGLEPTPADATIAGTGTGTGTCWVSIAEGEGDGEVIANDSIRRPGWPCRAGAQRFLFL